MDQAKITRALSAGGFGKRTFVHLFKDGDNMGVLTNAVTEEEFVESLASELGSIIDSNRFLGDWEFQLGYWLPQFFDIVAKLRGYKSTVEESRLIYAGDSFCSESDRVRPGKSLQFNNDGNLVGTVDSDA